MKPIRITLNEKGLGIELSKQGISADLSADCPIVTTIVKEDEIGVKIGVMTGLEVSLDRVSIGGGDYEHYKGNYVCDPTEQVQVFRTRNKIMDDNFTVLEVGYLETQTHDTDGYTVTILNKDRE